MKVSYFYRSPNTSVSIERVFDDIICHIQKLHEVKKLVYRKRFGRIGDCISMRKYQGDINHITGDIHFLALFLKRSKTVLTIHDLNNLNNLAGFKKYIYRLFWFTLPINSAAYITTISSYTKNELIKYFKIKPEKIIVVHNPLSPMFSFSPKDFDTNSPHILQIGSLDNKNASRLVEAIKDIKCTLVLVRSRDKNIEQKLKEYNISFKWYSNISNEELLEVYKEIDILFFASTAEGFGLPIIEANAVGRAVITSNISSMPEIANDAALFVNPYSITEIKDAVLRLINDSKLRNELVENGLRNCKRFELSVIGKKYEAVYERIIINKNA